MGETFNGYAGWFKFLTFVNLIIQTLFFGLSAAFDVIGKRQGDPNRRGFLQRLLDNFYASVVFPLALLVFGVFWGLYALDRELILPKALDPYLPTWLNHLMHTVIVPFALVETISVKHFYPARSSGIKVTAFFSLLYSLWTLVVYFVGNIWTYPFLGVLTWPGRIAFAAATIVVLAILYLVGEAFNKVYWGTGSKGSRSGKSKKGKSN